MTEQGVKPEVDPAAGDQTESGEKAPEKDPVPYERFSEVNTKLREQEAANEVLKQQVQIYAANPAPATQPPVQNPQQPNDFEGLNVDGADFMTRQQTEQVLKRMNDRYAQASANLDARGAMLDFKQDHPDYTKVVGTKVQMAPALTKYLQENPMTVEQLKVHPRWWEYLYALGSAATKLEKPPKKEPTGDQEEEPQGGPASPSVVTGGRTAVSKGDRWPKISDEEMEVEIAKAKSNG